MPLPAPLVCRFVPKLQAQLREIPARKGLSINRSQSTYPAPLLHSIYLGHGYCQQGGGGGTDRERECLLLMANSQTQPLLTLRMLVHSTTTLLSHRLQPPVSPRIDRGFRQTNPRL
jgi:hypothetical protein